MIKTVIFDMDGTLINSDALVEKIYRDLVKTFPPIVPFDSLDLNQVMALSYIEVIKILYQDVKDEYLDHIMNVHAREKKGQLTLFPNIKDLLSCLKKQGYYMGLVTSELREIAIDEMKILDIYQFFDEVIAFDDVKDPKPHPEGILRILAHSHAKPHEAIMVGDQLSDALAAESAHVMSILMGWDEKKITSMAKYYDDIAYQAMDIINIIDLKNHLALHFNAHHEFMMCQITDLHLMNDAKDNQAKDLIQTMVNRLHPDLNILTGDQTMGVHGKELYSRLGMWMDEMETPYGFNFGNHDTEGGTYEELIEAISSSDRLLFMKGPKHLGHSNYAIEVYDNEDVKALIIMMDSHIDNIYEVNQKSLWGYGTITLDQMMWYERLIKRYPDISSYLFMHIPPYEVRHVAKDQVTGYFEETPSTPPIDTGFITLVKSLNHTKAVFFGHDHYNDFSYVDDHLTLAYGRVSGYYIYGREGFTPGIRWIKILSDHRFETGIVIMDEETSIT